MLIENVSLLLYGTNLSSTVLVFAKIKICTADVEQLHSDDEKQQVESDVPTVRYLVPVPHCTYAKISRLKSCKFEHERNDTGTVY